MKTKILASAAAVLLFSATYGQDNAKAYHLDTDEWLTSAKFVIGHYNRTAQLLLDFNSEVSMVTEFNCKECKVKVYDHLESASYRPGSHESVMQLIYQRSKVSPAEVFKGSFGSDYLCFNGDTRDLTCTYSVDTGPEFFMIDTLPNDLTDDLYAGMIGLSVDPNSQFVSLIEYLSYHKLIHAPMVSIALSK